MKDCRGMRSTGREINKTKKPGPSSSCVLSTITGVGEKVTEKPRNVMLIKKEDGYGFYLKTHWKSPMHVIDCIEKGSAADSVGLRNGEVVACVNGTDVMHAPHKECVKLMRDSGDSVELTVASKLVMEIFYRHGITATPECDDKWLYLNNPTCTYTNEAFEDQQMAVVNETEEKPDRGEDLALDGLSRGLGGLLLSEKDKMFWETSFADAEPVTEEASESTQENADLMQRNCRVVELEKDDQGYGFKLVYTKTRTHSVKDLDVGSPAGKSSLQEGDVLISVNNIPVEDKNHEDVLRIISGSGSKVTLTVVNKDTRRKNLEIKSITEEKGNKKPVCSTGLCHECRVTKKSDEEFEFFLLTDPVTNAQLITDITPDGPAERCGLRNGDRVIKINGINVENKQHQEIVKMIYDSSKNNNVTFLIAGENLSKFDQLPKEICSVS